MTARCDGTRREGYSLLRVGFRGVSAAGAQADARTVPEGQQRFWNDGLSGTV